jgi:hypothetical protein
MTAIASKEDSGKSPGQVGSGTTCHSLAKDTHSCFVLWFLSTQPADVFVSQKLNVHYALLYVSGPLFTTTSTT